MDIDIYLLRSNERNWQDLICMLVGKAWPTHQRISIACANQTNCQQLDQALWQQPKQRFIPHGIAGEPSARYAPVILAVRNMPADLFIDSRQSSKIAVDEPVYTRILDIVHNDDPARSVARERFKQYYQLTGQKPRIHEIT